MRSFVEWHDVPYHHVPLTTESKVSAFDSIGRILEAEAVDIVILARFMQVLPAGLCQRYEGRIVNIHHTVLARAVRYVLEDRVIVHGNRTVVLA